MFKKLEINNLRGINKIVIDDIRQFNLFVGKNSCGKTSVLEGLFLITGPSNPELPLRINNFRNINVIDQNYWGFLFNKLNLDSTIEINAFLDNPPEERNLKINANRKYGIKDINNKPLEDIKGGQSETEIIIRGYILEYLFSKKGDNPKKIITKVYPKGGEGLGFEIPKNQVNYEESLRGLFINALLPAGDLIKRFNDIVIRKEAGQITEVLKQIEPSITEISLGINGIYCDTGLNNLLPLNAIGGGMLKIFTVVLSIIDTKGGIVFIDEIENGLHYSSQEILWDAILKTAKKYNVQVFASTHSIENIKALSSSYSKILNQEDNLRVYRIEKDNNNFRTVSYNNSILRESLDSKWEIR